MSYSEWQNIETAPKDGTRILGYGASVGVASFVWCKTYGAWWSDPNDATEHDPEDHELTHWMPLPPFPVFTERG